MELSWLWQTNISITNLSAGTETETDFLFCSVSIAFRCECWNLNSSLTWPYMVADGFLKMLQYHLAKRYSEY